MSHSQDQETVMALLRKDLGATKRAELLQALLHSPEAIARAKLALAFEADAESFARKATQLASESWGQRLWNRWLPAAMAGAAAALVAALMVQPMPSSDAQLARAATYSTQSIAAVSASDIIRAGSFEVAADESLFDGSFE